jgi:hypothetical protein
MPRVPSVPGNRSAGRGERYPLDAPDAPRARRRADSLARPLARPPAAASSGEHTATRRGLAARGAAADDPWSTARLPAAYQGEGDWGSQERSWQDEESGWDASANWADQDDWSDEDDEALAPRRQRAPAARRPVAATRALLLREAHDPWARVRALLGVAAILYALGGCGSGVLGSSILVVGEPKPPSFTLRTGANSQTTSVVALAVKPLTSLLHPEQYDSPAQFQLYGGAACSPTVLAEVLTAWGIPSATIGHMIDELGPQYLSPSWGLLDQHGFEVVAAKHHMRADISWHLTYNQVLYLTNVLGLPVIVNFRRSYGYYSYFAGGHFLVVTGGNQQGVTAVDSSEYFIKYLARDVFDGLWQWRGDGTAMTVVIVPESYQYALPPI